MPSRSARDEQRRQQLLESLVDFQTELNDLVDEVATREARIREVLCAIRTARHELVDLETEW